MILRSLGLACQCAILLIAASTGVPSAARAAEHRLGLVIGEAGYAAEPLATPANDAGLIAQALVADGFDVTGYADLDLAGTRRAFSDFLGEARKAGPEATVVVYLAGYGVQFTGDDFLVPVDARIARDVDVPAEAVRLSDFSRDLAALPLKARVLVYDLARAHPFARGGTPLASGLAMVGPQAGSLVAFNTAPGLVAPVEEGDYGLYAQALAEMLQTKGLGADTLFARLRARVDALSGGAMVPWTEGSLETPLVLLPPATDGPSLLSPFRALMPAAAADAYWTTIQRDTLQAYGDFAKAYPLDPLRGRVAMLLAARREATTWAQTRRANVAAAYWTYMRRYPRGPHFADARRGLAALPAALEPPPRFDLYTYSDLPAPRPEELGPINRPFVLLDPDDASLPAPPATVVPERPAAFYDLLPPLLAVTRGTLPLPAPAGTTAPPGTIVQPDFGGPDGPVVATDGIDKSGDPTVRQTGRGGRLLSVAVTSRAPNGGSTVVQTGPDATAVMKTIVTPGPNGGRTVTQTGAKGQLIATVTTLVAAGNRVTTVSGRDGLPRSIVTTTAAGTIVPSGSEVRIAATAGVERPVVLQAPPNNAAASAPPLLATGQSGPGGTAGGIAAPTVPSASAPPRPPQAPPASPQAPPAASPQTPDAYGRSPAASAAAPVVVAPVVPTVAPIKAPQVPEPVVPTIAPIASPTIASPTIAAPAPIATPAVPQPAASHALSPEPPAPAPQAPKSEPSAAPVPPHRTPGPVTPKALETPAPVPQPTPPQRPKARPAAAKAAPAKGAARSAKALPKPARRAEKPARKKPSHANQASGKHHR